MLDLAQEALTKRKAEERDYRSLVTLMDKKTYLETKSYIQKFQQELVNYLSKKEQARDKKIEPQELYALNIQLLPLSTDIKGKEES